MKPNKLEKWIVFNIIRLVSAFRSKPATNLAFHYYKRWGMKFTGKPNYISPKVWFDGTDYSLISIGHEVTISSYIRILTHDWSLHTVAKAFDVPQSIPIGRTLPVHIGDYSFIGTGTILMPGCKIGKACIIGAGTVVRGEIPDYSIVVGSPGEIIGDVREYLVKKGIDINQ